ncbi:MAG: hypothetical protein V7K67_28090 [Nostoc sp.]
MDSTTIEAYIQNKFVCNLTISIVFRQHQNVRFMLIDAHSSISPRIKASTTHIPHFNLKCGMWAVIFRLFLQPKLAIAFHCTCGKVC